MKGYRIQHNEFCLGKIAVIEQCNFHDDKVIGFYGWTDDCVHTLIIQTVAIFKIKYKCDKPT